MSYQHQYQDGTNIHYPMGKVVCVGRNYAGHAKELNNPVPEEPLLFIKPGSSVVCPVNGFNIPQDRGAVHFEIEIAVLIGKPLSRTPCEEEILDAITGYAPALDLTLRDVQEQLKQKGWPWEAAKAFAGSCVIAPFIVDDSVADTTDIDVRLSVNGQQRQAGNSSDMLFPIVPLIRHMAQIFTLQPGDVILTGTPAGVGPLQSGDEILMELPGQNYSFSTFVR